MAVMGGSMPPIAAPRVSVRRRLAGIGLACGCAGRCLRRGSRLAQGGIRLWPDDGFGVSAPVERGGDGFGCGPLAGSGAEVGRRIRSWRGPGYRRLALVESRLRAFGGFW